VEDTEGKEWWARQGSNLSYPIVFVKAILKNHPCERGADRANAPKILTLALCLALAGCASAPIKTGFIDPNANPTWERGR
jgi:hypothetical protein